MRLLDKIFGTSAGPSARQLRRAMKQVTETHGDASVRVGAMERLAEWKSAGAIATLLRRFTIQVLQGSMDLEEKQYAVRLLTEIGRPAVEPILQYLKTEGEVTFPTRALQEILPRDEYFATIKQLLEGLAGSYTRWPEAKAVLVHQLSDEAYPMMKDVVLHFLEDDDDDVCIAAADYLARNGDDDVRERLLMILLNSESRPRVKGRILDHFCDREWPVKGYRKRVEECISDPFYMTSKGTVKRREV